MNYLKHYNTLIERSKTRMIKDLTEKHHIIPRCLGGTDDISNIAVLTTREHYIAHQLLVKIHPNKYGLVLALFFMTTGGNSDRSKNRTYEWMREKHRTIMKELQGGVKNSQYGTTWAWVNKDQVPKRIPLIELENHLSSGWDRGIKTKKTISRDKKIAKKIAKMKVIKRDIAKILMTRDSILEASQLFKTYSEGQFSSVRNFAKSDHWDKSHVSLTKFWKKYLPEYSGVKQGKRFK